MDEELDTSPHGIKEYGGYFGFDKFGDSNVDFWLFVQAKDRLASFWLRSALMQRLHRRLNEEGIVINYPVRTLQFPDEQGARRTTRSAPARSGAYITCHIRRPRAG